MASLYLIQCEIILRVEFHRIIISIGTFLGGRRGSVQHFENSSIRCGDDLIPTTMDFSFLRGAKSKLSDETLEMKKNKVKQKNYRQK